MRTIAAQLAYAQKVANYLVHPATRNIDGTLTDVANIKSLAYAETSCAATAITDDIETTATGGTVLRYDFTAGQFVYNWQTPKTAGKCYRITMTTQDGSSLVAFFKLK